mgnify:CR=1 FL=1
MSVLTAFELLNTQSAAAAEAEAGAGDLWGVSLGTTTKAVAVGSILVVQATKTRSEKLCKHSRFYRSIDLPFRKGANMDLTCAMFYALGKMDGA